MGLLVVVPILGGVSKISGAALRSHLDVFGQMMISPVELVLPLLAVILGCVRTYAEVNHRWAVYTRSRLDARQYVSRRIVSGALFSFFAFSTTTAAIALVAFAIWPLIGDPFINPGVYELTPQAAAADAVTRVSFSQLLAFGWPTYVAAYSLWLGLVGATYAALGSVLIFLLPNGVFAMLAPFGIFLVQTVVVSLLDRPELTLMYSAVPFGLRQADILIAIAPTLLLLALVFVAGAAVVRTARTNPQLS